MRYKKPVILLILILVSVLIHFYSAGSFRVENNYSLVFYPPLAMAIRFLTGWFPFSIGDILYGVITIWLIWGCARMIIKLFKKQLDLTWLKKTAYQISITVLIIYIVFNVLWGINYSRKGIAYQTGLEGEKYTAADLQLIDSLLLQKVNASKLVLLRDNHPIINKKEIFSESTDAYKNVAAKFSFLVYKQPCIKSSLWGWVGNYLGFTGYYNPFTGEAQVNTTVPYFLQPYTTCHEMAHQLGYAKEDEANFVGYLAASSSTDTLFHYSVYLDLFLTANRNLYDIDSASARRFAKQLLPEVKSDLKVWNKFIIDHRNPVEPVIRWLYGKYLESNHQPSGILTYDEVTGLLIAYHKKYNTL